MKHISLLILVILASLVCVGQITPSDDAYIDTTKATTNFGAAVTLGTVSTSQTAYIRFDLSSIPSGYTGNSVAKASLKLYVNAVTTAGSFNVDYVNGVWAEKTINANNAPPPGTMIAASVPLAKTQVHDFVIVDVTTAVQAWLNGTETNNGIALVANSPLSVTFDSKESTTQSHPPELDVVFAGGGGTITGINTAAGSGLTGGGTSGTLNLSLLASCASGQVLSWNGSAWVCANLKGGGTVTSVGLSAPSTDFIVTGSPVKTSGTLGLGWLVAPDWNNTPGAIVKRDSAGSFSAGTINAGSGFNLGGTPFAFGLYANQNAFFGFAGNSAMTGVGNTASGYLALHNNAGNQNTASGGEALLANTTGYANTASGYQALYQNTTGAENTASGYGALESNTTGYGNTANGSATLLFNTTGSYNTASGYAALSYSTTSDNNTATGYNALYNNTIGYSNTADGYSALYSNTTGIQNTASGGAALQSNKVGNFNTGVGYLADVADNLTNTTAVGAYAYAARGDSLVLGMIKGVNGGFANTNVGIGTTTPTTTLQVAGGDMSTTTAGSGLIVKSPDGTKCARIGINNSGAIVATSITCP